MKAIASQQKKLTQYLGLWHQTEYTVQEEYMVTSKWVPGHIEIEGNEKTDVIPNYLISKEWVL